MTSIRSNTPNDTAELECFASTDISEITNFVTAHPTADIILSHLELLSKEAYEEVAKILHSYPNNFHIVFYFN